MACCYLPDVLYHLLAPLAKQHILFNLFNYITFRAAGATVTALVVAFLLAPGIIRRLRERHVGQVIRAEGPASHHTKRGTPTMGGLVIILATVVPTLLWAQLECGEPHGRVGRTRDRTHGDPGRDICGVRLRVRPRRLDALPARLLSARLPGADDLLWRPRRRRARLPVVQRAPRTGVHGGHGIAGDRWRARDRGHHAQGRVPAVDRGRSVRRRGDLRAAPDRRVPLAQAAPGEGVRRRAPGLPHGAAAPPLRKAGVGGAAGRDAVLHPGRAVRRNRAGDAEGSMIPENWRQGVVAVVGLGKSGVAATRLLAREGVRVYASDAADHPYAGDALAELRGLAGVDVDVGSHDLEKIRATRAVVVSPGVPPDAPPLAAARAAGVPIFSEVDVGFLALAGSGGGGSTRTVAITGTNGKTTTTALVAHLLRVAGLSAEAVGNIGRPLAEIA